MRVLLVQSWHISYIIYLLIHFKLSLLNICLFVCLFMKPLYHCGHKLFWGITLVVDDSFSMSSCSSQGSCPDSHWARCSALLSYRSSNTAAPTPRLRLVRSESLSIPCCYLVVLDLVTVLCAGLLYW